MRSNLWFLLSFTTKRQNSQKMVATKANIVLCFLVSLSGFRSGCENVEGGGTSECHLVLVKLVLTRVGGQEFITG